MDTKTRKDFVEMRGEGAGCWLIMLGGVQMQGGKGEIGEGRVDGLVIYELLPMKFLMELFRLTNRW